MVIITINQEIQIVCTAVISFVVSRELLSTCSFMKKGNPTQVLFCEFCEIFKNIYFIEHLRTVTSQEKRYLN